MNNALPGDTFAGITVVDFSRLLPGPFATMLLADLGARVIKVEPPGDGDYARWMPPRVAPGPYGYSAFFEALNRGKESVCLDLKSEQGKELARALIRNADVVVEGFRPGVFERLGFDEGAIRRLNARTVYCRISGYGQEGPGTELAGHDLNFLARSGVLGLMGAKGEKPQIPAVQVGDLAGGALQAAFAIAAALYRRERKAVGSTLDISMGEGVLSLMGTLMSEMHELEALADRDETALSGLYPAYQVYETSDGRHIAVAAVEPKFWLKVCRLLGLESHAFSGVTAGEEGARVKADVAAAFAQRSFAEWKEAFADVDACVSPVATLEEVVEDELWKARGVLRRTPRGGIALLPSTSRAVPGIENREVPLLGAQTRKLAREVGWSNAQIDVALASGALAEASGS